MWKHITEQNDSCLQKLNRMITEQFAKTEPEKMVYNHIVYPVKHNIIMKTERGRENKFEKIMIKLKKTI